MYNPTPARIMTFVRVFNNHQCQQWTRNRTGDIIVKFKEDIYILSPNITLACKTEINHRRYQDCTEEANVDISIYDSKFPWLSRLQ